MANQYFKFKQFTIHQERAAMKVTTDSCLFGAWVAHQLSKRNANGNLLDIGSGTGLLSLMVAQQNPPLQIDAIEIDAEAAKQAEENITASPWKDRILIIHDDASSHSFIKTYDYILSNPPFYENELKSHDPGRKLAHHEGISISELLDIIRKNLSSEGRFFLLLPYKRVNEIIQLLRKTETRIETFVSVKQSSKHSPFRLMLKGSLGAWTEDFVKETMTISEAPNVYTEEFAALLKDYYLKL